MRYIPILILLFSSVTGNVAKGASKLPHPDGGKKLWKLKKNRKIPKNILPVGNGKLATKILSFPSATGSLRQKFYPSRRQREACNKNFILPVGNKKLATKILSFPLATGSLRQKFYPPRWRREACNKKISQLKNENTLNF